MDKNSKLLKKTETILGLLPPDHGEIQVESLKSTLFYKTGEATFKALPGFVPLATGSDLVDKFHREDRHLPASPILTLSELAIKNQHLYLPLIPWGALLDFQKQLLENSKTDSPEIIPLVEGIYLGPLEADIDLEKLTVPQIKISRFSLIMIKIEYQSLCPWDQGLAWEIVFEKPLKRQVS